jgi:hypothetical protein
LVRMVARAKSRVSRAWHNKGGSIIIVSQAVLRGKPRIAGPSQVGLRNHPQTFLIYSRNLEGIDFVLDGAANRRMASCTIKPFRNSR